VDVGELTDGFTGRVGGAQERCDAAFGQHRDRFHETGPPGIGRLPAGKTGSCVGMKFLCYRLATSTTRVLSAGARCDVDPGAGFAVEQSRTVTQGTKSVRNESRSESPIADPSGGVRR